MGEQWPVDAHISHDNFGFEKQYKTPLTNRINQISFI